MAGLGDNLEPMRTEMAKEYMIPHAVTMPAKVQATSPMYPGLGHVPQHHHHHHHPKVHGHCPPVAPAACVRPCGVGPAELVLFILLVIIISLGCR